MVWDWACDGARRVAYAMVVACGLGSALCAAPGTAAAAPGFTAPFTYPLPAGALASETKIGYATGGIATVAYLQFVSFSPTLQSVLHVGVIPPGGTYTEQFELASTATSVPSSLALAEAPDGAAVLEYSAVGTDQPSGSSTAPITYWAAYRAAGSGTWQAPATIATDPTQKGSFGPPLVAAISPSGLAAAGFDHLDPTISGSGGGRIDIATHPASGSWSVSTQLSPPSDDSRNLALGFDSAGDLTAAFRLAMAGGTRYTLASVRRPASSGIWGSLQDVTGSDSTSDVGVPQLAVAPDGSAVIAFQYTHYAAPGTLDATAVTRVGATGSWTAPVDVALGGASSTPEAVGMSADDHAYVLYSFEGSNSSLNCVGAVRAQAGGSFSSPTCVSAANFQPAAGGAVAFLGDDAYLAWIGNPNAGTTHAIQASRWPAGASQPDSATNLDNPDPSLSFGSLLADQDGSVAAFWTSGSLLSAALRAAAFDAGGPNLQSATVPAQATAGQPVTISAAFADLWSGLGPDQPVWSFGDGGSATGGSVTHTFTAPGTYQITVTSSDGLGNQTAEHYSIVVAAAPPVTGPSGTGSPLQMTRVGQKAARWAEPGGGRRRHRAVPIGTSFYFTLNQPARVKLTFLRPTVGHKLRHRCRPGRARHAARCVLMVRVGTIGLRARAGRSTVAFNGTISHHHLAPGSYAVTITAGSGAGAVSRTVRFRIVAAGR